MRPCLQTGIAVLLLLLAVCAASHSGPVSIGEGVYADTAGESITLGNGAIELRFDRGTGELQAVTYRALDLPVLDNEPLDSGADLSLDGKWLSAGVPATAPANVHSPWRLQATETEELEDGAALHVISTVESWTLRSTYRLWAGKPALARSATFTPQDGVTGRVSGARLALHGLRLSKAEDTCYALLSNYPPERTLFTGLAPGRTVGEYMSSTSGHSVMLHDSGRQASVSVVYFSRQETSSASIVEQEHSISVIGQQGVLCDARPGRAIDFGTQLLCVAQGDWQEGLKAGQGLYDLVDLHPPERTYDLAAKTVMYSAHPGGTIDSGFRDVGGYGEFAKLLPYLSDLGVNVLWLLPVWHGNIYAPDDYYALDPRLGTEEDLKALVDRAHGLGIRVLLDLIPHGPLDRTGFQDKHPELVSRNEDGSLLYWWGCLSCDYANPGWQEYMAEHAAYWVKRVGVDGYRVDCAMGGPPNWRPYDDNRPSLSGLHGGLGVLAAARAEMETAKPEILLLPEAGGPPLFDSGDFAYNWAFYFGVLSRLPAEGAETWVPRTAEWLENQRYSFPRGAKQLMFLENHDLPRALFRFGVGCQRALLALCALGDWTPFLYQDQEIGYGPYLRQLYTIRAAHDELTLGQASYTAVRASDPAVFTIHRSYGGRHIVAAINFRGEPADCTLDLSGCAGLDPETRYGLWDCFAERRLDSDPPDGRLPREVTAVAVTLDPYSPVVLLVRPPGELPAIVRRAPAPEAPAGRTPRVERDGDRVTVDNGLCRLQVGPDAGGLIEELRIESQGAAVGSTTFGSLDRRLWLGGDVSLGPGTLQSVEVAEREGEVEVISRGTVTREIGGQAEPALDYEARHTVGSGPQVSVSLRLTPRVNIEGVLGSLATTLRFPSASRWTANTLEGRLYDDLVPRRSSDEPYLRMYAHPHSDRLFTSQTIPLDPDSGFIGAELPDGSAIVVEEIQGLGAGMPWHVMLKERLGDAEGLHGLLVWADGTRPLTLERDRAYQVRYALRVLSSGQRATEAAASAAAGPIRLRMEGARYGVETPTYRAALVRSKGGSLAELRLTDAPLPAIAGSNVYSDYGIYDDWTDPLGKKHKTNASSSEEPDPDVTVSREGGDLVVTFAGRLRHPHGFGRSIMQPVTEHRVSYTFGVEPAMDVECAVRPHVTKDQVSAFLAQTLHLPGASAWAVYSGTEAIASGARPPTTGDRVWQSSAAKIGEADEPRIIVEVPGGTCAEFRDFTGLQAVQNLFLTRGSGGCVLFVAFLDGQPVSVVPEWRVVRYRIDLHHGTIAEVVPRLGLGELKETQ